MQGRMQQLTTGLFHDDSLAKELGKKATASDMVFFIGKEMRWFFLLCSLLRIRLLQKARL